MARRKGILCVLFDDHDCAALMVSYRGRMVCATCGREEDESEAGDSDEIERDFIG